MNENLAARDQRDSQRAVAPLMIALGAKVINNSNMTSEQTSGLILKEIHARLAEKRMMEDNEDGELANTFRQTAFSIFKSSITPFRIVIS